MKIKNVSRNRFVGLAGCFGLLSLLAVAMLCPMQTNQTYAEGPAGGVSTFSGWLSSSVTLTMADKASENIEPTVDGAFKNLSVLARVQVSNSDYYDVSIRGGANMVGAVNTDKAIEAIDASKTAAQFTPNTWGYTASKNPNNETTTVAPAADAIYKPMNASTTGDKVGDQVALGDSRYADDYYTLNFGAKVDTSLPADTYSSNVVLSVVASPKQVFGFDRTDTMQGMTTDICREVGTARDTSKDKYKAGNATIGEYYTKQLKDTRDGKYYWVAKLRDGNCWMVQNLDLSMGLNYEENAAVAGAFGLDGKTTELGAENLQWTNTPGSTTTTDGMAACATGDNVDNCEVRDGKAHYSVERTSNVMPKAEASPSQVATKSWNQGLYVYDTPDATTSCGSQKFGIIACSDRTTVDAEGKIWLSADLANKNKPEGDETVYTAPVEITGSNGVRSFIYVGDYFEKDANGKTTLTTNTGWTASTDADYYSKNVIAKNGTDARSYATNPNKTFDAHYLIGNYYQWNTATAGTGGTITNADATGSICPKNWKLPTSGTDNNTKNGSFYNLLVGYGLDSKITSTNTNDNASTSWQSSVNQATTLPTGFEPVNGIATDYTLTQGQFNIALNPLFFVRSGRPDISDGALGYMAGITHYWTSTASDNHGEAKNEYFDIQSSVPLAANFKYYGFSLRCLAI